MARFDIDKTEQLTMNGLKDFQRATVERIDTLFRENHRRVLVADEVGMGKTLIARGTIVKTARIRLEEKDDLFKVVYICSNISIANQNIRKLKVSDTAKIEGVSDTRLSMQHLKITQQELDPDSKIRIWVTYGDPVFCYFRAYHEEYFRYTFGSFWKLSVGAENLRFRHSYTEYPKRFEQRVSMVTPSLRLEIPIGPAWHLSAETGYTINYEEEHDISHWQLPEPLMRQINFWTGDSISSRLTVTWTHGRMTLGADYGMDAATAFDGFRHTASLTASFSF